MQLSDRLLIALTVVIALLIGFILASSSLPDVRKSKELVVVTSNGPNTYFIEGQDKHAGFENDLAWAFADFLGPHGVSRNRSWRSPRYVGNSIGGDQTTWVE